VEAGKIRIPCSLGSVKVKRRLTFDGPGRVR
jgi:hypothetical protein